MPPRMTLETIISPPPGPRSILAAAGTPYAVAAIVAFLFAASGPVAIILAVGARGGLAESDIASWIFAAFCLNSVISIAFTLAYRQPLVFLWSIPGRGAGRPGARPSRLRRGGRRISRHRRADAVARPVGLGAPRDG